MSYVGIDISKCSELKAHLDQAAADLYAHADTVQALLNQAGIVSCKAPAELRDVAAWANYRSRDLQKRIEQARAADCGTAGAKPNAFGFACPADARKAGVAAAKKINKLVHGEKAKEVRAALDDFRQHAGDVNFAAAFLSQLGRDGFAALLHLLCGDGELNAHHPEAVLRDMRLIAGMLARLSTSPSPAHQKLANNLLNRLRKPDLVGELAVLLSFGGFSSSFTAAAAGSILGANASTAAIAALAVMGLTHLRPRDIALQALDKDPEAAYLYVTQASMDELRALLDDPGDLDNGALAAKVLQAGLLDARATHTSAPELKRIEDALERVMHAIAHGAPLCDAARLTVAKALYPEFMSGAIAGQAMLESNWPSTHNGFHVAKKEMEKVFAELMKTDQSRAELEKGIRDYTANELAKAIATGKNFDDTCQRIGSLLGVLTVAAREYIHDKATRDDFALGILRDAGHIAVGALAKYTGPAAPITGKVGNSAVDKGIDHVQAGKQAEAAAAQQSFDDKVRIQVTALLAQIYYELPQYRALASPLPAGLQDPPGSGHLKAIVPGTADAKEFSDWLKANPDFNTAIARDVQVLNGWIHDVLLRG